MKITLKERKIPSGKVSLFIEYYKGSEITKDGKRNHLREYENLKLYIDPNAKTACEKKQNKENLALAQQILAIREAEYYQGKFDLKNTTKSKRRFLDFYHEKMEEKRSSPKNYGNWSATLVHLKRCISPNIRFEEIDETFVKKIRKYFDCQAKTKSNTFLSKNSKYTYFNKFKAAMRAAFDEGYISINYGSKIKSFEQQESQREYLTHEELQKLANTECKYPVLKRAFIFACLSGLRWSDINKLVWNEIREENHNGKIVTKVNFKQEKTSGVEYLYISEQARTFLGKRKSPTDRVGVSHKVCKV